jgi:hypothetical protein
MVTAGWSLHPPMRVLVDTRVTRVQRRAVRGSGGEPARGASCLGVFGVAVANGGVFPARAGCPVCGSDNCAALESVSARH